MRNDKRKDIEALTKFQQRKEIGHRSSGRTDHLVGTRLFSGHPQKRGQSICQSAEDEENDSGVVPHRFRSGEYDKRTSENGSLAVPEMAVLFRQNREGKQVTDIGYKEIKDKIRMTPVAIPDNLDLINLQSWMDGYAACAAKVDEILDELRKGEQHS